MGERNHASSRSNASKSSKVRAAIAFGTLAVLLGSGTLYLLLEPGSAIAESKQPTAARRTASRRATTASAAAANPSPAGGASNQRSQVIAHVNDDRITWQELAQECVDRHGEEVLDNLINKRLIEQECAAKGIRVTSGEIDAEIARQAKTFRATTEQWLKLLEDERNLKPEQYARDIVWPKLALKKLTADRIEVTAEDLQKGFESSFGPRVKARMILMHDQRQLQQVWAQAKASPENFGRLARDHSEDPGSRALDGQIQPIAKYSGYETLWKTAFSLKKGELSGIIQLGDRYAILLCEGRTEPIDVKMEEVRQQLHDDILEQKTQMEIAKVFQELKDRATIETYLEPTGSAARATEPVIGKTAASPFVLPSAKRTAGTRTK